MLARQDDDVANGVLLHFELVHLQRMIDELAGRSGWGGRIRRIGHIAQQREVAL